MPNTFDFYNVQHTQDVINCC